MVRCASKRWDDLQRATLRKKNLQLALNKATSNVALSIFYQPTSNVIHAADEVKARESGLTEEELQSDELIVTESALAKW